MIFKWPKFDRVSDQKMTENSKQNKTCPLLVRWTFLSHTCKMFPPVYNMQKLYKSINIFQSYDHKCTATFLWFTVYNQLTLLQLPMG